jgi:hypothetical protein
MNIELGDLTHKAKPQSHKKTVNLYLEGREQYAEVDIYEPEKPTLPDIQ